MINNDLDLQRWHAQLRRDRRVQIPDFLQADAAELLSRCLLSDVPWRLAYRHGADPQMLEHAALRALTPEDYSAFLAGIHAAVRGRYGFAYESYMMVEAYTEGFDPKLPLHAVTEFMNSPELLEFARQLTGEPAIRRTMLQATRYRPGHFLKRHDDEAIKEGRLFALVINLTRGWQADSGGLLQFLDPAGAVLETYLPQFNSLALFQVPADHCVSLVAPWAEGDRVAITGWFMR